MRSVTKGQLKFVPTAAWWSDQEAAHAGEQAANLFVVIFSHLQYVLRFFLVSWSCSDIPQTFLAELEHKKNFWSNNGTTLRRSQYGIVVLEPRDLVSFAEFAPQQ